MRHSSCPVDAHRTENLAISSGQVRPPREVQGTDISAGYPATADRRCGGLRMKHQPVPAKVAGPGKEPDPQEFKVTRAREVLLYRDFPDTKVSSAGITVRTGRKW